MKVTAGNIDSFLNSPPDHIQVVLLHGRDSGLVYERGAKLAGTIVEDLTDPFRVSELTGSEILGDSARLNDEVAAQSLVGGKRVVRIRLGAENISNDLRTIFEGPKTSSLVIIESGFLPKSSPVRRILEMEYSAAVIACFEDSQASLSGLISEVTNQAGLIISQDAKNHLLTHLGSDRMVSRRELEKLVLYAGKKTDVSLEDVLAIIGDSGALSIEEIVFAATNGNRKALSTELSRAAAEGLSPITLLRATQRHIHRLLLSGAAHADGKTPAEAMNNLRPPVLFLFAEQFQRQLVTWTPSLLRTAVNLLTKAETQCKSSGLPERVIGERTLFSLAQMVKPK